MHVRRAKVDERLIGDAMDFVFGVDVDVAKGPDAHSFALFAQRVADALDVLNRFVGGDGRLLASKCGYMP